ncbi:MAG TPA: hypothetical protein VFE77_13790 [Rhodanobacter sp.]|nr:hypothetical protein [Rhodanobacter sp.]
MNAAHQRRLTPVLSGIAVLLGALFVLLLSGVGRGVHWSSPRSLPPLPPPGNNADLPQPKPLQQFSMVWQKPLFNPDRQPVAHAAAGGSNLGDLELTGIIITPDLRMALLHDKNGDREIRLREGATLPDGSVTLVEVHQRSAVFDSAAGRTELKLPAGAPIDQPRDGGRDRPPPAPGAATVRVQQDGAAPRRDQPTTPAQADHPESAMEQLRRTVQKRRAERAAASHEGEH